MVKRKRTRKSKVPKPSRKSSTVKPKKNSNMWVFVFLGIMVLFSVLFNVSQMNLTGNVAMTGYQTAGETASTGTWIIAIFGQAKAEQPEPWMNIVANGFKYLFGDPISTTITNGSVVSAIIVTIAIWLFIFFTFADIISVFGTFSKVVAWIIGFLIAVVAANIGVVVKVTTVITGIFAGLGVAAVYVGLGCAFAAFLAINLGIGGFKRWAVMRQAGIKEYRAEAGGRRLAGGIKGLGKSTRALEELGQEGIS